MDANKYGYQVWPAYGRYYWSVVDERLAVVDMAGQSYATQEAAWDAAETTLYQWNKAYFV